MASDEYWVEICQHGVRLGAGFLLTRCHAVTAFHCLTNIEPDDDSVDVKIATGETLHGRVYRRSPEADLALVDIPKITSFTTVPTADRPDIGEKWRSPYRPSTSHAYLTGKVAASPVKYQCEGGDTIEAMQLDCSQSLGDYSGYSGGPVERSHAGADISKAVLGILVEQYPEQYQDPRLPGRASAVLFAATIAEVFRRFECFDVSHLLNILDPSCAEATKQQLSARVAVRERHSAINRRENNSKHSAPNSIRSKIKSVSSKLEALDDWQKRGLLGELDVSALRLRALQYLMDDGIGGEA
jgi:hypothetical protein